MVAKMMAELHGKNRIKKFRQAAEELASRIAALEGVAGIIYIGGLVRGFVDKYSDIDVIVLLDKNDRSLRTRAYNIGLSGKKRYGIDIDLEVHFLEDFRKWKWGEAGRWEFSKAKVAFDPKGKIKESLREKLHLPTDFWIKRIAVCTEYMKWYCCPLEEGNGTISEAWVKRGDLACAHYCLNYGVELAVRTLFALNKQFLPAPKWRLFYSHSLTWLPESYEKLVKQAMIINEFSIEEYNRRSRTIKDLWQETKAKIEEVTGLTLEQLSRYYVEKILHQEGIPSKGTR